MPGRVVSYQTGKREEVPSAIAYQASPRFLGRLRRCLWGATPQLPIRVFCHLGLCRAYAPRHAATYSKHEADVRRLLDDVSVIADLGERWNAIVAASAALTATPVAFGPEHVERLRRAGLDDLAISDVIHAAAFFNWANRLMLSLGEPAAQEEDAGPTPGRASIPQAVQELEDRGAVLGHQLGRRADEELTVTLGR